MRILAVLLLAAALAALAVPSLAGDPFRGSGGGSAAGERVGDRTVERGGKPGLSLWGAGSALGAFTRRVAAVQRELRADLSARVRSLAREPSAWGLAAFLALALAYGAVHAAGPGHGKAVATTFVLARGEPPARAALLGLAMGAAHAASAVALVLVLDLATRGADMAGFSNRGLWMERVGYAVVACLALWIMAEGLRGRESRNGEGASPGSGRGFWATALATGLTPCPGAAVVLFFSMALGAQWLGLAAVGAMALGMGATIAAAATAAACCRTSVLALSASRPALVDGLRRGLSLVGGLVILMLALSLLSGTFV